MHSILLIQILPSLAPMQRMTALSFALCGLALCLTATGRRNAAAACALPPLLIALAVGAEYLLNVSLGIDELLGRGHITVLAPYPGRMSQITMVGFVLIASALLSTAIRRFAPFSSAALGLTGSVTATVGLISGLSRLVAPGEAYVWGHINQLALHTRLGFFLLGTGLLATGWKENSRAPLFPKWLPLSAWLSVSLCVLGLWQAFILSEGHTFAGLSLTLLIGGLIFAALFAITVSLAQTAFNRNVDLTLYRMALENSFDGLLITSLDGSIQTANPSACRIFGRSEEEIRSAGGKGLVDEDDPRFEKLLEERRRTGRAQGEVSARRKDGFVFPIEVSSVVFKDARGGVKTCTSIRDISERKQAQAELRLQTERLLLATRTASIGVWDLDLRTQQTVWDDTLFEMFGIAKQVPMPYSAWVRTVHPDDLSAAEASLRRVIEQKTRDYCEFRITRPDGSLRHIASSQGAVLDERGQVVRIVGVGMDITDRKHMEEELAASARLSALGMMAGGVAHEVNNPLAIIRASASNLLDILREDGHASAEEVARSAGRIQETADRIAKIVKILRHLSREGSQDEFLPASVRRIVEETLELCQERFQARSVALSLPHIDPALSISCREVQIAQVLLNLLANAFDAVVEQPGEKWVRLQVTQSGEHVVFSIIDSGSGIPTEIKSRIMEPFFTTKEVGKGMGLGLSLSRHIAEEHGGKLELAEESGHTCFRLTLPVAGTTKAHAA
ncbi:MAG TPA: PAS domain S-box protein [Alphaproteobacteria bacterium]|nr:PAS domain S-box protein [Alphaproteobacteria bacterium]